MEYDVLLGPLLPHFHVHALPAGVLFGDSLDHLEVLLDGPVEFIPGCPLSLYPAANVHPVILLLFGVAHLGLALLADAGLAGAVLGLEPNHPARNPTLHAKRAVGFGEDTGSDAVHQGVGIGLLGLGLWGGLFGGKGVPVQQGRGGLPDRGVFEVEAAARGQPEIYDALALEKVVDAQNGVGVALEGPPAGYFGEVTGGVAMKQLHDEVPVFGVELGRLVPLPSEELGDAADLVVVHPVEPEPGEAGQLGRLDQHDIGSGGFL